MAALEQMEKIDVMVLGDRRLKVPEIMEDIVISYGSPVSILNDRWGIRKL